MLERDRDEERLADRVLLQTWREWRRGVIREEAEAEAPTALESGSPIFAGVARRDLEREGPGEWARVTERGRTPAQNRELDSNWTAKT